ncbi:hypothetical protein [Methylomarinum vadi]|uniref:hypothetical protein n=1 Tax=Methylomarinum vadi TaxID=438855 RepID=UPI0004DF3D22|nr:hypothetical protein [Methylomarinum vadi]
MLELALTRNGGETLTYRVSKAKDKEEYTLKVSSRPEYFRLTSYQAKPLIESASLKTVTETIAGVGEQESVSNTDKKVTVPDTSGEGTASE